MIKQKIAAVIMIVLTLTVVFLNTTLLLQF